MGNLRFSVNMILTCFIATHAGMVTSISSSKSFDLPSSYNRTLLYHSSNTKIRSFGNKFSPVTFSVQSHSTSEQLRTL